MDNKLDIARKKINEIDEKMAKLFAARMETVKAVAEHKKENGIPVTDALREQSILSRGEAMMDNDEYKEYYRDFQKNVMALSKDYQKKLIGCDTLSTANNTTVLSVNSECGAYPIIIGRSILGDAAKYFDLDRRVVIVTDDGVPGIYAEAVKNSCKEATVFTVPAGEKSKSFDTLVRLLEFMCEIGLTREDCVVAVGGGVVGDLSGFAASVYMRGIDFYNVPTTLLSQVDSSIGGKTAVNLGSIKNAVGSFKQPKAVLIDTDTLDTLPLRHKRNGLSEAIKMAVTLDEELFCYFENHTENEIYGNIEEIIVKSLGIKKSIVEADERECGKRRVLNFGHTLGHAIESSAKLGTLLHGECVAIGMVAITDAETKKRIKNVLRAVGLPTEYEGDEDALLSYLKHDKKSADGGIHAVITDNIGTYNIRYMSIDDFANIIKKRY